MSLKDPIVEIQWQIDHDPTHLNQVAKMVSDAVHDLLANSLDQVPSHLNGADFRRFKQIYGLMGFRCRNSNCRTTSKFYKTDQERVTHEKSHRKSYNCTDCNVKPGGFSSANTLRKHKETYHAKPEDFEVPRAVVNHSTSQIKEEEDYIIKCFCGFRVDDGNTVLCDRCDTWQHIECYYYEHYRNGKAPDVSSFDHTCVDCLPRVYDKKSAIERQKIRFWPREPDANAMNQLGLGITNVSFLSDLARCYQQRFFQAYKESYIIYGLLGNNWHRDSTIWPLVV